MSALANFMISFGCEVSGSDMAENVFIHNLRLKGCKVFIGHNKQNITSNTQLVVYTGAIKPENEELQEAKKQNIPVMERSEFLGWVAKNYQNVIAISGTHGKTTTTAMLGEIFLQANKNPTIHLGGESNTIKGNFINGDKQFFITEACEYRNSFHYITATTSVITNIEKDHTDWYNDMGEILESFTIFAQNSAQHIVIFENNKFANTLKSDKKIITCGFDGEYDVNGFNLEKNKNGTYSFEVKYYGIYMGRFDCDVIGVHNAKNALCAIAVAMIYGINIPSIYKGIKNFKGVKRRYEKVGDYNGIPIIADYAHHPTEIKNSIAGALLTNKKILCIFQPHTYTRTKSLLAEFKNAFKGVNKLAIYKTYPAREKYVRGGSALDLYKAVKIKDDNKFYATTQKGLINIIKNNKHCDIILVLGAGDIYEIIKKVCTKLKKSVD